MAQLIPKILTQMLELQCCEAKIGYAGTLRLGIGHRVFYTNKRLEGIFHGQWDILSVSSAWRVVKNGKLLCGSYDSDEESNTLLNILVGEKLSNIVQTSPLDFSFEFTSGITVDILGQSGFDRILEVFAPGDIHLDYFDGKWIESSSIEPLEGLGNEELNISSYSEKCHKRWKALVPKEQKENQCRHCIFFRSISGKFYFWDYGLCSNDKSDFDGKVVAVWSGCSCFNTTLS